MDRKELLEMRDYYDTHSTADEMSNGRWEADVGPDPMVTTSPRLPKSVLDGVREQAAAEHVKPPALVRRWIEQRHADDRAPTGTAERLERLEQAVFHQAGCSQLRRFLWLAKPSGNG